MAARKKPAPLEEPQGRSAGPALQAASCPVPIDDVWSPLGYWVGEKPAVRTALTVACFLICYPIARVGEDRTLSQAYQEGTVLNERT